MSSRGATRTTSRKSTISRTASSSRKSTRKHDSAMGDEETEDQHDHQEDHNMEQQDEEVDEEEANGTDEPASATITPAPNRSQSRRSSSLNDSGSYDDTPTRLTRKDEKSQLQGLNRRLEDYILTQRERNANEDGWRRELDNLKNKHAADLEHQKNLFEKQLFLVRKNRDELSAKLSNAEGENAYKDNLLTELQGRANTENKARSALEQRVDALSKDLMNAQNREHGLNNKLSNLQHEYDALKSSHADLEKDLEKSRQDYEKVQSKANKLAQQYSDLSSEYDVLQTRHSVDQKKYDKQIHELCTENSKSVDSVRAECESRLHELFKERQNQYDHDKTACLHELKQSYDTKLYGYRQRLEELGHELEQSKSDHRSAQKNYEKEMKYADNLKNELKATQARVESLEKSLASERANPDLLKQLHEKNEIIKKIKVAFKRKDQEFDELMDVKILLDLEIKAYRNLLDQEDKRLGVLSSNSAAQARQRELEAKTQAVVNFTTTTTTTTTSSKKGSKRSSEASSSQETETVDLTNEEEDGTAGKKKKRKLRGASDSTPKSSNAALLFSRSDDQGTYVAMTNNSSQGANLSGWILRAPLHNVSYTFPDTVLATGATYYLVSKKDQRPSGVDLKDIDQVGVWPEDVAWNADTHNQEDTAELVAPSGAVVASVVVAPLNAMDIDTKTTIKQEQNQCAIM